MGLGLAPAYFAHMFEKYVDFLMTSIGVQEKGPPIHLPQTPSPRGVLWTKRTLAQGPDREKSWVASWKIMVRHADSVDLKVPWLQWEAFLQN